MPSPLLLGLFFASGTSGLLYQVLWMRLLALTLSVTVYAVSTVLCAFMAGLGLGAVIGGRLADRVRRPLVVYGLVEIAIGLSALATCFALFRLGPAYAWLYSQLGGAGFPFVLGRFALAFVVLLVPCTLMGTTLPLLSRAVVTRRDDVASGTGILYAVNTLGAVGGCLAAGFVLIPSLGLTAVNALSAALNVGVGLLALARGRQLAAKNAASDRPPRPATATVALAAAAFGVSGFTAMGYEILWTRALESFAHNSTYAYSAMLATFLLGIAIGSAVVAPMADRLQRPLLALAAVEVGIGLSVIVSLRLYAHYGTLVPRMADAVGGLTSWVHAVALIFTEAGAVLLVTTLLFGASFPLAARAAVDSLDGLGTRIATVYAANTLGSVAGALVVGFVLVPALGVSRSFTALVTANVAVGAALALFAAGRGVARWLVGAGAVVVAVAAVTTVPSRLFEESFTQRFGKLLFYREEVTDTVMVTEAAGGERMIRYGDGRGTAGTMTVREDRIYAHIALLHLPEPRRVLSICFGVGNSLSSILQYPQVERVDAVELSPGVVDAAPFFARTNRTPLADPRVHLAIQDGRNFLLTSTTTWDAIRLDPPELHTAGVVNLYTREFFELARAHLAPGGVFSIWVNVVMTPEEDVRLLARTIADVFPYVSVWQGPLGYSWVFNGSVEPRPPDLTVLRRHFASPPVAADLDSIGIADPAAFLQYFVLAGPEVLEFAGAGPIVTDDRTRLDFSVPRSVDSFFGISNANTDHWLVQRMDPNAKHDVALGIFFRKASRMRSFKRPVLGHVLHADDSLRSALEAPGPSKAGLEPAAGPR